LPSRSSNGATEDAGGSLLVKRQVTVKARLTEALRQQLAADFGEAVRKLDTELSQLDFQSKRLLAEAERQGPDHAATVGSRLGEERRRRAEQRSRILASQKELGLMPLGTEIVQGTLEGLTELRVGDNLASVSRAEVVIEDGIVVEIREGAGPC
jgi:F0F1-type ATP synthase membrane subunit b/b'